MPRWGRPPGAQLGRHTRKRGGPWVDSDPWIEEMDSGEEDFALRGWPRYVMGHEHGTAPGPLDGEDYDMYEDTDSTVAYAVQLAMKGKEEWLVDKALERIRRAQFDGQKNVRLSRRELEALERMRLQTNGSGPTKTSSAGNRRSKGTPSSWRSSAPPSPLDTSIYGGWAKTTSSSVSPQSSTSTLRSPLQPPFTPERHAGSSNYPPAFFAAPHPPPLPRPYPDDYQRMPPYQMSFPSSPIDPSRGSPARGQPYMLNLPSALDERQPTSTLATFASEFTPPTPEPVVKQAAAKRGNGSKKGSPSSSGDEVPMVEVIEHRVPSTPTRGAAGRGSRQRSRA